MSEPQPSLFFVLGVPKSGTTWLQHALNAHPEVVCKGEGKLHYFRDRLAEAGVAYNRFIADRNVKVFGEATFPPLKIGEIDALFRTFVEARLREGGPFPGISRLGAKDPDFGLYINEFALLFPDANYLHIIRDPRDAAVSMLRHMQRVHPEYPTANVEHFLKDSAIGWKEYLERVRLEAGARSLSYREITYEAMVAEPKSTLGEALSFLRVDASENVVSACVEAASFERLSGGRSPGNEDRASFFRKGMAGGWVYEITAAQATMIMDAAGQAAADLGYR